MKIRQLLLVSLLGLPLIACGRKDTYTVTEAEFFEAIQFKGVSYLQTEVRFGGTDLRPGWIDYYAPNAYRWGLFEEKESTKIPQEKRIFKNSSSYQGYYFNNGTWTKEVVESSEFQTISYEANSLEEPFKEGAVTYSELNFDSKIKAYHFEKIDISEKFIADYYFKNKKIIKLITNFSIEESFGIETHAYSYKKKKIEVPTILSQEK